MANGPWLLLTQAKTEQPVLVNVGHVQAFKRHAKAGTEVCWIYGEGGVIYLQDTPEEILAKLSEPPPPRYMPLPALDPAARDMRPRPTASGGRWAP